MRSSVDPPVRLFGTFEYGYGSGPLSGPARKLLARLILSPRRAYGRAELAETLWPEADPDRARFYLRRALSQLRPLLSHTLELEATRETVRLTVDPDQVDALAFDAAVRQEDEMALNRAIELHTAPLLADWTDDWLVPERESRRLAWHRAIETLASEDLQQGRPAEAARRLTAAVALDPLREGSQRLLIEALRRAGDRAQAERQYGRLEREMQSALGFSPLPETRAALRGATPLPPLSIPAGSERYLPVVLTEIVGREGARSAVLEALESSRLVTLVGTGGIGKTRLALSCAEALPSEAADLVAMVDLASQESGRPLGDLLARSIKAPAIAGVEGSEAALRYLEGRCALILLDNCEHVIDAACELAQAILGRCRRVTILATSRQALGLPEETIFEVPPLDLPSSEALFLGSVTRKGKQIPPSPESAEEVLRICRALDGLPLALSLAAGALRTTTLSELARDIHEILGTDHAPRPRHRSLRAATDWSYRLLSPEEARVMRSISPVHGFWTLEYACAAAGPEAGSPETVRASLRNLVSKSLVGLHEDEKGVRYRMLEPLREDAFRRLREEGEEDEVRRRLHDAVLARSHEIARDGQERFRAEDFMRAEGEMDVIESVLQDCLRTAQGRAAGTAIVLNILLLFDYTNRYREGVFYQERFLVDTPELTPWQLAHGRTLIVHLRANWGYSPGLLELAEEAVVLARQSGDEDTIAYALCSQAAALFLAGDFQQSQHAAEEALILWRRQARWTSVGAGSIWAAKAAMGREDWAAAEAHLDQAALHLGEARSVQGAAVHGLNRARLRYRQGSLDEALRLFAEAEEAFTGLGDRVHSAAARVGRSACLATQGAIQPAAELVQTAEDSVARLIGDPRMLYDGLGPADFRQRLWTQVTPRPAGPAQV